MSAEFNLGIQSYCFRKFLPLPDLIDALRRAGLSYVEIWPRHLPWTLAQTEIDDALSLLEGEGISVSAYGAVEFSNDETAARPVFAFAQRAGIGALTVTQVDPDALSLVDRLSEEYGVLVAIHNHGRHHHYGRFKQIEEVFHQTSRRFGLCLDAAWFLDAGCDPIEAVDVFQERLYGVHLKDFVFDDQGGHEDVIIGSGGLDLPRFMKRLQEVGFDGYLSIEYEGDPDDPLPQVIECVRVVQDAIDSL